MWPNSPLKENEAKDCGSRKVAFSLTPSEAGRPRKGWIDASRSPFLQSASPPSGHEFLVMAVTFTPRWLLIDCLPSSALPYPDATCGIGAAG
jgi:hypothetical protein